MANLVSVIIPAYNCRATLCQAIDSVLQQQVPLEVLVIDDGSVEPIADQMEAYADDPRVIFLKNAQNIGVSATRNRGVREAKGEWIAFLDADDYWERDKLVRQLARLKETNGILCSTGRELMKADGELTGRVIPVKETITYRDLLSQNWINNSSVVVRRDILLEFPMEADEVHEDYLLWLRVLRKYHTAYAINEPLLKYRVAPDSKSGRKLHSAVMTYKTYRRAGLGRIQSCICFVRYAIAGIKKYYI
ncbi:MAG: glycosyltransferase family 2 protein [Lachnospiraceae bacterium]|nr:glycosyltransferase family 2 protein [Lachnospiraceae bacterium]